MYFVMCSTSYEAMYARLMSLLEKENKFLVFRKSFQIILLLYCGVMHLMVSYKCIFLE